MYGKYKRYAKKGVRNAGRYLRRKAKARYQTKTGGIRVNQVVKDVAMLKGMINAEKQNITSAVTTEYDLAQYNGVSSTGGRVLAGVMPNISQGFGEDNRKGDSIKVCSWALKIQVYNNGNDTLSGCNYKFYLVRQPTNPASTSSDTLANFLETNPFSGVNDFYSNRNYEHYKDFIVMGVVNG